MLKSKFSLSRHFEYANKQITYHFWLWSAIYGRRLLSSLQNGLTKQSSSYTIWFQMRCWMTSCLNHDYLILIFVHFPYTLWKSIVYYRLCRDGIYFDKILVSEYKLFKRSNKANCLKIYDKRDDFNFKIIYFPNMCSNIPASPTYGVYISQLIRYASASSNYSEFLKRHLHLRNRLLDQGYSKIRLIRSLKKFIFRYQDLVEIYSVSAEKIISDAFWYSENV
jgi:hypothetical protein